MPLAPIDEHTAVDYLVAGEAQPGVPDLVLVHGTGGSAESNWLHLVDGLRDGRRVIAPNYAGSGRTTDHGGELSLGELVAQVDAAATHAGSERYDVVGFSLGAVVGAQLAADRPERVRRLVLVNGWGTSASGRIQLQFDLWQRLHAREPRALAELLVLTGFSPGFLAKRPAHVIERMVEETLTSFQPGIGRQAALDQQVDLSATFPRIRSSTLVIGSREDHIVPVDLSRQMVAPIRWSDYHEISSGHLVIFEQPAELVSTVTRFFARPDRRTNPQPISGPERRGR
ncbi:MAG: alpha/beta fold hydrolase [Solirubrobacteraceae bacterium]|nr:alpha/beta fold hydrolase [Patulibacter sp.]